MPRRQEPLPPNCLNCGTPLAGPWCHACGQPVKGMVRHFGSILGDVLDTLFEYDNRIWRTLAPLYFRPGRITVDFLAGRRMRYVLPFRLFFVLSVVAFLTLQLVAVPDIRMNGRDGLIQQGSQFERMDSVEEVIAARDAALAELEAGAQQMEGSGIPGMAAGAAGLRSAQAAIREDAERRIAELERAEGEVAEAPARPPGARRPTVRFGSGEPWDAETNPVRIEWLPEAANQRINRWIGRAVENTERVGKDPMRLWEAMLGLLPAVLFVLMPIFALLLKLFYLLKRRLYMEHLVVALHSHSFLFLAILVSLFLTWMSGLATGVPLLGSLTSMLATASLAWIPLYLLLMQRRVYAQNWALTVFKFGTIGLIYTVMIGLALAAAAIISLVKL
jgi:hypothetical protein